MNTKLLTATVCILTFTGMRSICAETPLPLGDVRAEGFSPERLQRVRAKVQSFVKEGKHAGSVWLIARNGKIMDYQAVGYRGVPQELPMEKDTICRIYSMSKIVTCVSILSLLEEGKLMLDDPIERYLPELKSPQVLAGGTADAPQLEKAKTPVTLRHLLTHTSGYIYDFGATDTLAQLYQRQDLWHSQSLKEFASKVAKLPLKHQPGEAFTYGINQDILGAVIETVSGRSFEQFIQYRICEPLGMKDTSFDVPAEKMSRLAKIYTNAPSGNFEEAIDFLGSEPEPGKGIPCGGAGIFSTVGDYARFAQMLLNGGELDGKRVISRKSVELMTANHMQLLPANSSGFSKTHGFGLGVEVRLDLGRGGVLGSPGQFGWYGAATTYCQIDPKEKIVAIMFCQHFPFNQHGLFDQFANAYYQALE